MQQEPSLNISAFGKMLVKNATTLVTCGAIGAIIGFGSATLQTPIWKSTAQIDQPKVPELGNYYNLYSTYTLLNGGENYSYTLLKNDKNEFSLTPEINKNTENLAIENTYSEFKRNLTSPDVLQNFLLNSETVKEKAKTENKPISSIAQAMAEQFSFQQATKSMPVDRMSVYSTNPEEANKLLSDFINFANLQTKTTLNNELVVKWKTLFQFVKGAAEKHLGAIQQGNQITAQDWNGKLNMMLSVQPLDDRLVAYRFIKTPSVPTMPDSPNKSFWLMIGTLSGLLLGVLIISFSTLFRRNKNGSIN